jgi:hypothetical protein
MAGVSHNFAKRALNAINLSLLVVLCSIVFRLGFSAQSREAPSPEPATASANAAPAAQHVENATLVLALATDCPYCEQSLLFYQALLSTRRFGGFRATAVFSEPVSLATEYLRARELSPDEVRQAKLIDISVVGTPTLSVLDEAGRIRKSWAGLLSADAQREIVDMLGVREPFEAAARAVDRRKRYQDAARARLVSAEELPGLLASDSALIVVDTRQRAAYRSGHIEHAMNIPFDELPVRAPIELPNAARIVVFCQYDEACEERYRERNSLTYCTLAASTLARSGASEVSVLTADLDKLRAARVRMVSSTAFQLPRTIVAANPDGVMRP